MKNRFLMAAALVAGLFVFAGDANAFTLLGGGCGCDAAPSCCEPVSCCKPKRCHNFFQHCRSLCQSCCNAAPSCGCDMGPSCAAPAPSCGCDAAPSCGCDNGCAPRCHRVQRCCKPKRCHNLFQRCKSACGCGCDAAPSCGCDAAPSCGCGA